MQVSTDQNPGGSRPIAGLPLNARQKEADAQREQKKKDIQVPIVLLVFGIILILVNLLVLAPKAIEGVVTGELLKWLGLQVAAQAVLLMPCYFLAVNMLHAELGLMDKALLKLGAIAVLMGGLSDCIRSALTMTNAGFDANYINWGIRAFVVSTLFWLVGAKKFDVNPMPALIMLLFLVLVPIFGVDCLREFVLTK